MIRYIKACIEARKPYTKDTADAWWTAQVEWDRAWTALKNRKRA